MPFKNKEDKIKYHRQYNKDKRNIINPIMKKSYHKLRQEVIDNYGGCCNKCGFIDIRALQIDHVDGGGSLDRKTRSVRQLMFWIKRNNYPKSFQILCANCNSIKRIENKEYKILKESS